MNRLIITALMALMAWQYGQYMADRTTEMMQGLAQTLEVVRR